MIFREHGDTPDGHGVAKRLFHLLAHIFFAASHGHRWQKVPVRKRWVAFSCSTDTDIILDDVVKRREVGIRDRPVLAVTVVAVGLEIEVAQPVALPGPQERPPSQNARSKTISPILN